ncbi:MAG: FHA domain-containing protein [Steroidobacteraceae bacterium]
MNPPKTTARPSVDLDATDELPVLDVAAYEAATLSLESPGATESRGPATESDPPAAGSPAPELRVPNAAPAVADPDVMSSVEHWIVEKTEELRALPDALSLAQSERAAAVARAGALSRELAETNANLEASNGRERTLKETLTDEQEAAHRRVAELDAAQRQAARLAQELADARAAESQRNAALAASGALLEQHSGELEALQRTHATLIADQQRTARELSELETRLRDSETRERNAQRTVDAQKLTHAELTQRAQHESGARERLATELKALQGQLANCVESLHTRESYRAIYQSSLQELDAELAAARLKTAEQEARANQLNAELQSRDRGLKDAVRERDEARHLHDTEITQHASERGEGERRLSALESRLAELTAEHADACAQRLALEATLAAAQQRAEAETVASGAAAERLRELDSAIASRQAELTNARLEIERNRALLADLTAALLKSQTMFSDQGRLLEEREAAASAMATSHAEQSAQITMLRGQIEQLTARLATPDAERRTLEERVAELMREAVESESRLTRLESMNSELRATVGQLDTLLAERDAELQRATQMASMNAYALGRVQTSIDELGRTLTTAESASSQAQVSILTRVDNGQNHSVVLRGRTTIGRDRDNDLPLAMRSVSRHHAVLIPGFRTAFVQDLSSTNGVLVNQRRVRCARLEHGDMISFGEAQFRYTVTPAPAGAVSTGSTGSGSARASLKHAT